MSNRASRRVRAICVTFLVLSATLAATPALAGPFAFVVNRGSSDVTVADTWTHRVQATLPTAPSPRDAVVSPDGGTLYVATDQSVTQIDLRTLDRIDHPYAAGLDEGNSIVIHPNGRKVWVSHRSANFMTQLDVQTGVVTTIPMNVFDIRHIAISESGTWIFAVTQLGDVVQLDTTRLAKTVLFNAAFPFPTGIATGLQNEVAIASDSNLTVEAFSVTGFGSAGQRQVIASGFRTGAVAKDGAFDFLVTRPWDNMVHRTSIGTDISLGNGSAPLDVAQHDDTLYRVTANLGDVTGLAPSGHGSASFLTAAGLVASVPAGQEPRAVTIAADRGWEVMGDPGVAEFPYFQQGSPMQRRVEVVSVGDDEAFVWQVSIGGPDAAAFKVVSTNCRHRSLPYQARCAVDVEFTAIPKLPPWWARYIKHYIPSYYAELEIDDGREAPTIVPMRAGAFVKQPELTIPATAIAQRSLVSFGD